MKNRKLDNFEKRKQDLKAKYDRDRKTIDDQIEREKEARRRERERKKAQREREKSLPPQPVKPSPDYDPAYNAFIRDSLSLDKMNEILSNLLEELN